MILSYDDRIVNRVKSLVSEDTWDMLVNSNAMIAGGVFTSIYTNKDVNDIDVYFSTANDFASFIHSAFNTPSGNKLLDILDTSPFSLVCVNITNKSILFMDRLTKQKVQIIAYKLFPDLVSIFDEFDFSVNMAGMYCRIEEIVMHDDFLLHNSQRYIGINANTAYPITSVLRVQKYRERGYKVSKAELLKLLFKITTLNITSWDIAKDHCGGMYGLSVDEIFPEDKDFSMDLLIESLDTASEIIPELDSVKPTGEIDVKVITKSFPNIYNHVADNRIELSRERIFKNVKFLKDNKFCSYFNNNFEYSVGMLADGGKHGIFGYRGADVIDGQYNKLDSWVIELELLPNAEICDDSSVLNFFGQCRVINAWSRCDFISKYK
jgi:hypothetical protein